MTPAIREQFRLKLLQLVDTAGSVGMRVPAIDTHLAAHGYDHTEGELVAEIESRTEGEAIVCLKRIPTPLR